MKRILFFASALAGLFLAGSCQRENLEPMESANTVTYTVQVPGALSTKTIGENVAAVTELVYEVYRTEATSADDFTQAEALLFHKTATITDGTATVEFELVNDQNFRVLFWAQVPGNGVYNVSSLKNVTISQALNANAENYAAFAGADYIKAGESIVGRTLPLVRPIAQLNIGTDDASLWIEDQTKAQISTSAVKVNGLSTSYNVAKDQAGEISDVDYVYKAKPVAGLSESTFEVNSKNYNYVAMNYVGFAPQMGTNVEVTYTINTENVGTIENTIDNVPVKANHRTNIVGNLITSMSDYTITLDTEWQDLAGGNMEVIIEGIVKNINGDYEISTVEGFAHAINKLFADGGTFYIHPGTYDFTGLVVVPQSTKPGVILNVKANEVPVVTRSTPGFEIIGLDVDYLVSEVTDGSQAIFSNLVLPEDTKLVGENNGIVAIAGCSNGANEKGEALVKDNVGTFVNITEMNSVDKIVTAMNDGLSVIELTDDITSDETLALVIDKSIILDGCGHTLTATKAGSDARAININGADGVTIKNLNIVAAGERAINIIKNANNVTIDNVTATAANYTVNVAGSAPRAAVNIKNSTLNGLCTVNVSAELAKVTVENSTINCNDNNTTVGESYSALSLNKEAVGGQIIAANTVVNVTEGSDSYKGRNGAENGVVTINGSTDDVVVMVAAVIYPNSTYYHAFVSLDGAIDFAHAQESDGIVTLIRDITVAEPVIIDEGQTVVLDLNGYTISAGLKQEGRHHYAIDNYGNLTLKGEGYIEGRGVENFGTMLIEGDITITNLDTNGGSAIWNEGNLVINNGTFTTNPNAGAGSYGGALFTQTGGSAVINGGNFKSYSQLTYAICNYGETIINNATVTGRHGAVASKSGCETVINAGSFSLLENPGVSDHCVYYVSSIKGGTFTLGNNTDSGAKVFCESTIAEGYKAVKTAAGNYTVIPNAVEFAADDAAVQAALANTEDNTTIYLDAKEYTIEMYTNFDPKESLTIIGTEGTKVKFANAQVRLQLAENFTIKNCEILHMATKTWGMLVFGGRDSGAVNCTVSNCSFKGVGTQGIYINENISGAVYNIENCTFDGDFGAEGAITIQDNADVNFTVNVNGCAFNNIPSTSHEVCLIYGNKDFKLISDVELKVYTK